MRAGQAALVVTPARTSSASGSRCSASSRSTVPGDGPTWLGFVKAIPEGREIELYHNGMVRDFTSPASTTSWTASSRSTRPASARGSCSTTSSTSARLSLVLSAIRRREPGRESADQAHAPFQSGDVYKTHADVGKLRALCEYAPRIGIRDGVARFVDWHLSFYGSRPCGGG
jgi:UDP-glucuronate 4-epimerase